MTVRNRDVTGNDGDDGYETGPDTEENAITDNYFCTNADGADETGASGAEVSGNTYCG